MVAPVGAGELRFRLRFEKSVAVDAEGGTTTDWAAQFERRAAIRPLKTGSEPVLAQRLQGVQPVFIFIRLDSETRQIDPSWRCVELVKEGEGTRYAIKSAADMERERKWLTIMAESGVADGGN